MRQKPKRNTNNKFMLFILVTAAVILTAAVFFLLPDTGPPVTDLSQYTLEVPGFSHETGVYNSPFFLTITPPLGTTVHYTLDGSNPTQESPVYEGPLLLAASDDPALMHIPSTSDELYAEWGYDRYEWTTPQGQWLRHPVVRAVAINDSGESSTVVSHTYLMGRESLPVSSADSGDPTLPVVLLITDPDGFFSDETGIYVPGDIYQQWRMENPEEQVLGNSPANYLERGRDWERPGQITLLEPGAASRNSTSYTTAFTQNIGLRIHGGFTRSWAQKTLRLYARTEYDTQNWFEYPVFPDYEKTGDNTPMTRYKRLLLRNSGNDWSHTLVRDALMQRLVSSLDQDIQAARPTLVYLNGEYWGIHYLRERLDEYYLSEHYNMAEEDIILINERGWEVEMGHPMDLEEYKQHMSQINGFVLNEEERYALADTLMDMDHWFDYLTGHLYAANTDWINNNMRVWRKRTLDYEPDAPAGQDGRWRWMFFDLDYAFDFLGYGYQTHDTLTWLSEESELFEKLSRSTTFRNRFAGRMADMLNTVFSPAHVHREVDVLVRTLAPEMERNVQRWPQFVDMEQWQQELQVIHDYADQRPDFLRQHTATYFNFSGSVDFTATLPSAEQGHLRINTLAPEMVEEYAITQNESRQFQGQVFADIPLTLEAIPTEGWQFSHWEGLPGQPTDPVITLTPTETINLRPVFIH